MVADRTRVSGHAVARSFLLAGFGCTFATATVQVDAYALAVPRQPALAQAIVHCQAIVCDAAVNAAGFVIFDVAAPVVGS
jgi:hypothetical protein